MLPEAVDTRSPLIVKTLDVFSKRYNGADKLYEGNVHTHMAVSPTMEE